MNWKICVSILSKNTEDALKKMEEAKDLADLIEIRLDSMESFDLERLIKNSKLPLIVTFRSKKEGGFNKEISEAERIKVLKKAVSLGADYVDIELDTERDLKEEILKSKKDTKVIISKHFFEPVPENLLYEHAYRIFSEGADIGKIIGYAKGWYDNFLFLRLVDDFRKKGYSLISFAMGEYGKLSRIISPIFGSPWTYCSLREEEKAAPGQITATFLRRIWEEIKG